MTMHEYAPTDLRPTATRLSVAVAPGHEGLSRIRRAVHDWLDARGVADGGDTAVLLVNELVTNVQRHAPGPARLRLFLRRGLLHCEVVDIHRALPRLVRPAADAENGRGLQLVNTLALRWGSIPLGRGKVVWFDLPVATTAADAVGYVAIADIRGVTNLSLPGDTLFG